MNQSRSRAPLAIELVTDKMTPKSCSLFIAELIKYIVYSKQQIPYPYPRLKMYVLKRREKLKSLQMLNFEHEYETQLPSRDQLIMEKYFKKVEEAFDILESTFKCIEQKLVESNEYPLDEIVILFGATPISPKDMYRIAIPPLTHSHSESQNCLKKQIPNMFRGIIVSEPLHNNLQRKVGLTNMFVMFKVRNGLTNKWVLPKDHYRLSSTAQQVQFSFTPKPPYTIPCDVETNQLNNITNKMTNLSVCTTSEANHTNNITNKTTDLTVSAEHISCNHEPTNEEYEWFQNELTLKGFKDSKRKGKSVADLWYKQSFL